LETLLDECPLVRHVENLKLLKTVDQTGHAAILISEWMWFFEALAFLAHGGDRREIYCAVGTRYVVLSKTPIERKPTTAPRQRDLFDLRKADR
jgi:hypothetical protein